MKKELPPALLWGAIALGIAVLVGAFALAGGTGAPTAKERQEWAEQATISQQRSDSYLRGASAPGSGGEAEARARAAESAGQ